MKKSCGWLVAISAGIILTGLYLWLRSNQAATLPVYPVPNGYDVLVDAARQVDRPRVAEYRNLGQGPLEALLQEEADTIALLKTGLSRECRVRTTNSMDYIQAHVELLAGLKSLAHLLAAQARLAELREDTMGAAKCYLDLVRLGQAISQGGLLIDGLVGIACEEMGVRSLETIAIALPEKERLEMLAMLRKIDQGAVSPSQIVESEREWARQSTGLQGKLLRLVKPGLTRAAENAFIQKRQQTDLRRRRLIAGGS